MTCTFKDHPNAPSATDSDVVNYRSPCISDFALTVTGQTSPPADKFTGNPISSTITPFSVQPNVCKINYRCGGVTRVDNAPTSLTCDDINFPTPDKDCTKTVCKIELTVPPSDYGNVKPGCFNVAICGTVDWSEPVVEKCADMQICLEDPCDPPTAFAVNTWQDQEYIIYDQSQPSYTPPVPTIEPNFCKYNKQITVSPFINGNPSANAITQVDGADNFTSFSFFWTQDLSPLGRTQLVQGVYTTYSDYQTDTTKSKTLNEEFSLTFKSPCQDARFTTITPRS